MATLELSLNSLDGYSSKLEKIIRKTYQVTDKIFKANAQTDKINNKFEASGASAGKASMGFTKLFKSLASIENIKKGMGIIDEFTNTSTRLASINDGLQTQTELQNKVFAAANRSRGSYTEMASAIYSMGIMAKDSFKSNDELIAFAELAQKSFKIGGASAADQTSSMQKLTKAMSDGKLQGEDFLYIMEKAPMMADAISKFTGKSNEELGKMTAEGEITSDIIKNAMFMAASGINTEFGKVDMTFADLWNKIKNVTAKAFGPVMTKINDLLNTDGFNKFLNAVTIGFDILAKIAGCVIDTIINGWDTIGPILSIIGAVYLVSIITKLWAMIPPLAAQASLWLSTYLPILLVIGIVISAARQLGATWEQIFSTIGGVLGVFTGYFYNRFVYLWNEVAAFINFLGNVFKSPVASIQILFYDLVVNVLGFIEKMAQGIEDVINKIPCVEVDITSGLGNFKDEIAGESEKIKNESEWTEYVKTKEFMDYSDAFAKGSNTGKNISNYMSDTLGNLTDKLTGGFDLELSSFGTSAVEGTGSNGSVKVNMADEDLQYLRDIAERDYINQFSTATLAPSIQMTFGDIHEEADANKVAGSIKRILQEEIATVAEGVYN